MFRPRFVSPGMTTWNWFLVATGLVLLSLSSAMAQPKENKKVKFMAKAETRNSFVQTHHATFIGVRSGFEFKFPVRFGLGYYWMFTRISSQLYDPGRFGQNDPHAEVRMRYAMGYVDYNFYEEDDWTLSVPVQVGIGETFYRTRNDTRLGNGLVIPMEAGVAVDYLFLRWLGFGVGLGYRVMLYNNSRVLENFNSPYYQIRLNVLFTELFRGRKKRAE